MTMLRFLLASLFVFVALPASAAPFVVADVDANTTHCQFQIDGGAWGADVPITAGTPRTCRTDVATVSVGSHTVLARAVVQATGSWPRQESAASAPFTFTRPAAPTVPAGTRLVP